MQKSLTDTFIRNLAAPTTGRLEIGDTRCAGLAFRVTPTGSRSWCFRYTVPDTGRDARVTIGGYPDIGLGKARELADAYRAAVAEGRNPIEERRKARAGADTATFAHLAARYMKEHAERHKKSHKVDGRNLRLHVLPRWKSRAYASITRADVVELLERIIGDGKPVLCNRLQSLISKIFSFAIDAGLVTASPCFRLKRRGVERARRRILSDAEIRVFWSRVGGQWAHGAGDALRLALLTGARRSEIAAMNCAELEHIQDAERAAWVVPAERSKGDRAHVVPLAPAARAIVLEWLGRLDKGDRYLFPARGQGDTAINSGTLNKVMARLGASLKGDSDAERSWRAERPTPHDLRRTFNSRMAALGVPQEIRAQLLNHAPASIEGRHYDQHNYFDEKRRALAQWDTALAGILSDRPATVVPIGKARQLARS